MIAVGVNAKALSTFMGHANIAITIDLYGHLMPGSEAQAADLLDAIWPEKRPALPARLPLSPCKRRRRAKSAVCTTFERAPGSWEGRR